MQGDDELYHQVAAKLQPARLCLYHLDLMIDSLRDLFHVCDRNPEGEDDPEREWLCSFLALNFWGGKSIHFLPTTLSKVFLMWIIKVVWIWFSLTINPWSFPQLIEWRYTYAFYGHMSVSYSLWLTEVGSWIFWKQIRVNWGQYSY